MIGFEKEVDAGLTVTLHEAAPSVGHRFHGDFQGIENWTTKGDVRDFLTRINVDVNFRFEPYRGGVFAGKSASGPFPGDYASGV